MSENDPTTNTLRHERDEATRRAMRSEDDLRRLIAMAGQPAARAAALLGEAERECQRLRSSLDDAEANVSLLRGERDRLRNVSDLQDEQDRYLHYCDGGHERLWYSTTADALSGPPRPEPCPWCDCERLTRRAEAAEAEVERLEQSRALCIEALRGVPATGSLDEQTWDVVADGIASLLRERDDYRILSNQMHRRAQEAERLVGLAMRVGQAECEAMRARMQSAERALTGPGVAVNAETWLRGIE